MAETSPNFDLAPADEVNVGIITMRAANYAAGQGTTLDRDSLAMDITGCHNHACALDLEALARAEDTHVLHDAFGIRNNLNRETLTLDNLFSPRFSMPEAG